MRPEGVIQTVDVVVPLVLSYRSTQALHSAAARAADFPMHASVDARGVQFQFRTADNAGAPVGLLLPSPAAALRMMERAMMLHISFGSGYNGSERRRSAPPSFGVGVGTVSRGLVYSY
jgi:hypothetical protein